MLLQSLGASPDADVAKHSEALTEEAERMLRAGVRLGAQEWLNLLPVERDAFVEASIRIEAERTLDLAAAIGSPDIQKMLAERAGRGVAWRKGEALAMLQGAVEGVR